jgi:putative peptidoglycan lipid II flippase
MYRPIKGWFLLLCRVLVASAVLAAGLMWCQANFPWLAWRAQPWHRALYMTIVLVLSVLTYFSVLLVLGTKLKTLFKK